MNIQVQKPSPRVQDDTKRGIQNNLFVKGARLIDVIFRNTLLENIKTNLTPFKGRVLEIKEIGTTTSISLSGTTIKETAPTEDGPTLAKTILSGYPNLIEGTPTLTISGDTFILTITLDKSQSSVYKPSAQSLSFNPGIQPYQIEKIPMHNEDPVKHYKNVVLPSILEQIIDDKVSNTFFFNHPKQLQDLSLAKNFQDLGNLKSDFLTQYYKGKTIPLQMFFSNVLKQESEKQDIQDLSTQFSVVLPPNYIAMRETINRLLEQYEDPTCWNKLGALIKTFVLGPNFDTLPDTTKRILPGLVHLTLLIGGLTGVADNLEQIINTDTPNNVLSFISEGTDKNIFDAICALFIVAVVICQKLFYGNPNSPLLDIVKADFFLKNAENKLSEIDPNQDNQYHDLFTKNLISEGIIQIPKFAWAQMGLNVLAGGATLASVALGLNKAIQSIDQYDKNDHNPYIPFALHLVAFLLLIIYVGVSGKSLLSSIQAGCKKKENIDQQEAQQLMVVFINGIFDRVNDIKKKLNIGNTIAQLEALVNQPNQSIENLKKSLGSVKESLTLLGEIPFFKDYIDYLNLPSDKQDVPTALLHIEQIVTLLRVADQNDLDQSIQQNKRKDLFQLNISN